MSNPAVAMRHALRDLRRRQLRLAARQEEFERDRLTLFNAARSLDPPMTWMEIARIMGVTEAAVANLVKRNNRREGTTEGQS